MKVIVLIAPGKYAELLQTGSTDQFVSANETPDLISSFRKRQFRF